ncbi:Glutamyl-tRNA(Gln) amidotransferase subunit B mitochondrial [Fasciola hepatica]|uniref:Glutamyl-tRNA(Gln) amidotransferase subunit B, mitochondrial n=1 Tax=Fasciola hepatica TaxID=6192 RepID=A0A4E0RWN4_FASHE|nr:Glutamyl-tRNA(Gln) amidotransferase subunit B mitochondrial [Fasciola hepatica]
MHLPIISSRPWLRAAVHKITRCLSQTVSNLQDQSCVQLVPLIGLELHAQLASRSKLFSRAPYKFAAPPNSQLALLDWAVPGSMPVLNRLCVEQAVLLAFALNCTLHRVSRFDRKHYFYADSPSGYQITQYFHPIATDGYMDYVWSGKTQFEGSPSSTVFLGISDASGHPYMRSKARIRRIQLEQDTGKSLHDPVGERSLIDFNRAGVGLVEIVTEPDFVYPYQAAAFVNDLVCVLSNLGVCGGNAAAGELRVDVNVSVGPSWTKQSPRTEVKNVNSIRGVARAIEYEIGRQMSLFRSGIEPINETRSFDPARGITLPMRDKEVIQDYRYMPEPNIPHLRLVSECTRCQDHSRIDTTSSNPKNIYDPVCVECMRKKYSRLLHSMGAQMLPNKARERILVEHALGPDRANVLVENQILLRLFENCAQLFTPDRIRLIGTDIFSVKRELAYWLCGPLYPIFQDRGPSCLPQPETLANFVELNLTGEIQGSGATQLIQLLTKSGSQVDMNSSDVRYLAKENDWILVHDPEQMRVACEHLIWDNPKLVAVYKAGKEKKALKRLITLLTKPGAKYHADKFNPFLAERVIKSILSKGN